ncbi:MAG TPA: hypothetical protein VHU15_06685 [Stellaceae bacterium]|jgi:hypothetical protein|nr:hypothetical protein [Stellaceae bacterium]
MPSDRSLPIALFLSGGAFLDAARHAHRARCAGELKLRFNMPIYYLYSHAIELTLKAFLRARGVSAAKLRNRELFGHSLQKLWNECLARDIMLDAAPSLVIAEVVSLLDPYATSYEFRYIRTGFKTLPSLPDIRSAAENLATAVKPICDATVR